MDFISDLACHAITTLLTVSKGPDTRCSIARNIARNILHSTWLHGRNISSNITRKTWSAVTKLSCGDVYITQSKMTSLGKKKALGVLPLMLLDGEEKARIKRRIAVFG